MTNNESHEVAEFMRQLAKRGFDFDEYNIAASIGCDYRNANECWNALADLIDRPVVRGVSE